MQQCNINRVKNQGYILFIVLVIILLISIVVMVTTESTNLNLRSSSNEADRQYTISLAKRALKIAEQESIDLFQKKNKAIFPPSTEYDPSSYPFIFTQLLEGGPPLKLKNGETWPQYFTNDCKNGLCSPTIVIDNQQYGLKEIPSWKRPDVFNGNFENSIEINQKKISHTSSRNPRYIIEFLGISPKKISRFKITVKAWGKNPDTQVMLTSYVEVNTVLAEGSNLSENQEDNEYTNDLAQQALKVAEQKAIDLFQGKNFKVVPKSYDYNRFIYSFVFAELLEGGPPLKLNNLNDGKIWPQYFTNKCTQGLCAPTIIINNQQYGTEGIPAWKRDNVFNGNLTHSIEIPQNQLNHISSRNPRYIVEFLGISPENTLHFRVTVKAWGKNPTTEKVLESYMEMDYK